jgi:two-component system chemotaxis sensor kinase CheA
MSSEMDERREIITDFLNESRDLLDNAEPKIIDMEKKAATTGQVDMEVLNTVFRLFHSFKGTASFLDLQVTVAVTHDAETLLDLFRKGKSLVKPEHIDILCKTMDFMRELLDVMDATLSDVSLEKQSQEIIKNLKTAINKINDKPEIIIATAPAPAAAVPTALVDEMKVEISEDMIKMFYETSMEAFEEIEKSILNMEKTPDNNEAAVVAFRALHSLKGNAGFFGYGDIEQISHAAENVLDMIRNKEKKAEPMTITCILRITDVLKERVTSISKGVMEEIGGKDEIIRILNALSDNVPKDWAAKRKAETVSAKTESLVTEQVQPDGVNTRDLPRAECPDAGLLKPEEHKEAVKQQAIRVDVDKIDMLLDLVGELVITSTMVSNNPDLKGLNLERFEKAIMQHDKIIRDLQEVSMAMRMIPIAATFQKMVRLVRDLEQKLGKKLNLVIAGEDTEVDKTIIEQIADPLVHLIRNAADHGIETQEGRKTAGKPETGTIRLEAKHSAGEVLIIITDDGRGLVRSKLAAKGVEKGLITPEEAVSMRDEEIYRLICKAGFSTAEKVTNVSGRGVGMDVVTKNIENLRGKVVIKSTEGQGSSFIIHIPLTLAIIDGMVVRVGHNNYIIPLSSIRDSFRGLSKDIVILPDSTELIKVRGEMLPVIRLHKLYRIHNDCNKLEEGILMMVESEEKRCCIFVDEILGQQQIVIKGLATYLGRVRGVSGCSILGGGDISMILDIADLIKNSELVTV